MTSHFSKLWTFRTLAWTRVKPGEWREEKHISCFAIKAKRAIVARVLKPPVLYRAPSWTWASVHRPVAINEAFFYFAKRSGAGSADMQYEVEHLVKRCTSVSRWDFHSHHGMTFWFFCGHTIYCRGISQHGIRRADHEAWQSTNMTARIMFHLGTLSSLLNTRPLYRTKYAVSIMSPLQSDSSASTS